jgi:L-ascorbate metabolism protein UlaG (beta-lactamase superfamily)
MPRPSISRWLSSVCWIAVAVLLPGEGKAQPDACNSHEPAIIGGPTLPKNDDRMVLRWLGTANYELSYRGQVFLFDTYFNRMTRDRPIGFKAEQVNRADVIFMGHAHYDHIADIGPVARQTKAPVVGAPVTVTQAVRLGAPAEQMVSVSGGETLKFGEVTVDIALAQHSTPPKGIQDLLAELHYGTDNPEDLDANNRVRVRSNPDPDVRVKGTMAFGLTFPNGFKVVVLDSAGPITDGDRALAKKMGPVDIAIIAYQAQVVGERQTAETLPLVKLFNPRLYIPSHHDGVYGAWIDIGIEPLLEKIREEMPETSFVAPLYRSPICVGTTGSDRAKILSFRY